MDINKGEAEHKLRLFCVVRVRDLDDENESLGGSDMSFGDELSSEFYLESRKITGKYTEEKLFKAMQAAFENLSHRYSLRCGVTHGGKSLVEFYEMASTRFFYAKDRGKTVKCELADLLIVSVNTREMRICCLQNKFEKGKKRMSSVDSFYADMRQFYLLNKRPVFELAGRKSTLLNTAICPSVGSYGVFYSSGADFEMNYYSAEVLNFVTTKAKGRRRKVIMDPGTSKIKSYIHYGKIVNECQYTDTIKEFGNAAEKMTIGTPFSIEEGVRILGKPFGRWIQELFDNEENIIAQIEEADANGYPGIACRFAVVIRTDG